MMLSIFEKNYNSDADCKLIQFNITVLLKMNMNIYVFSQLLQRAFEIFMTCYSFTNHANILKKTFSSIAQFHL